MTLGTAEYTIIKPDYNKARVDAIAGGGVNAFMVRVNDLHLAIESDFDYKPRNGDEFQGVTAIDIRNVNATFDLNVITELDEATGDYFPYMDIKSFSTRMDDDAAEVSVIGGTPD